MGRKMCVVREKSGRASLRVRGLGVCMSMNAIEGRNRTIFEEGYFVRCSCSSHLFSWLGGVISCGRRGWDRTLPRMILSAPTISERYDIEEERYVRYL